MSKIASVTPEQVSALWNAYHASRSEGTGRGYLCAAIPVALYEKMLGIATQYPSFVYPISRNTTENKEQGEDTAYEFYFYEWSFFDPPTPLQETTKPLPKQSVILFTPLQEYKLRQSFASPYLTVTHYTDLVNSHGLVLLRGEITPSPSGTGYLLTQEDAQRLCVAVQKFYLWEGDDKSTLKERLALLERFHTDAANFEWKDLLKHAE